MSDDQKLFNIQRVYLKDASFESPAVPELFFERVEPRIDIEYRVDTRTVEAGRYETTLGATVTARTEDRTIFIIEVSVGGVFGAQGFDDAELKQVLNVFCPAQLFPYLRETVSSISSRGGFAPVLLALVNFEEMYAGAQRAQA
jgi:preprotein translocase subunit SecB